MEQKIRELEARLAELEQENQRIRSALQNPRELRDDLVQEWVEEMNDVLDRLKRIEKRLETWEEQ